MKAITLMAECRKAVPDANVFVLGNGRYTRVEKVVLAGVDPVVTGLTSVCLDGDEYFRIGDIPDAVLFAEAARRVASGAGDTEDAPDSDEKVSDLWRDPFGGLLLFNLYTQHRPHSVFSKRVRIVRAMLAAMLRAEATL